MKILFLFLSFILVVGIFIFRMSGPEVKGSGLQRAETSPDQSVTEGGVEMPSVDGGLRKPGVLGAGPLTQEEASVPAEKGTVDVPFTPQVSSEQSDSLRNEELSFLKKYEKLSGRELHEAWTTLSQDMGRAHSKFIQELVKQGRGEIVSADDWSFRPSKDSDFWDAGFSDGETLYRVPIRRFDNPALFLLRDEHEWLTARIYEVGIGADAK